MFDAQLLMTGSRVYTPWLPRGGDNLFATLDIVAISGGPTLTVKVFTKNSEDAGDGTNADTGVSIAGTAVGRSTGFWEGKAEEWVRYSFDVASGSAGSWVLFRMLEPNWFDTVDG